MLAYLPDECEVSPHVLSLRWQFRGEGGINSPPVAADGLVYAGSNSGELYALDPQTGQEVWRFKMGKQTRSLPIVVEGVVYIGSGDGYLDEVDAQTGAEIARYGIDSQIYTAPAAGNRRPEMASGRL